MNRACDVDQNTYHNSVLTAFFYTVNFLYKDFGEKQEMTYTKNNWNGSLLFTLLPMRVA